MTKCITPGSKIRVLKTMKRMNLKMLSYVQAHETGHVSPLICLCHVCELPISISLI